MGDLRLNFFVIGAMKSGTTSLHHYLVKHPALFLPREKEAPYFSLDEYYARGMSWYLDEFFSGAREGQLLGTVSPQYMAFPGAAIRINRECPYARLVAILRDPAARAESHYRMMVRIRGERRTLEQAVAAQLRAGNVTAARLKPDFLNSYVAWGEYGRILNEYRSYFHSEQLLVVFSDELASDPASVLGRIFRFIGVADAEQDELYKRYHTSARRNVVAGLLAGALRASTVRRVGKRLLPERYKRRMRIWAIMNRDSGAVADIALSAGTQRLLAKHFLQDAALLEDILQAPVPWRTRLEDNMR